MQATNIHADLEIRILKAQDGGIGAEMTLNGEREFPRGRLDPTFLEEWASSGSSARDGERLFSWLLASPALRSAWDQVQGQYPQRRIRLRIDSDAPRLHLLPWELLQEPGTDGQPARMLAATAATPFSRYLAGTWEPGDPIGRRPIKILLAIANPTDLEQRFKLAPVDVELEWKLLQDASQGLEDLVELTLLPQPCTLSSMEEELRKGYHILHIVSHGTLSERTGDAALLLAGQGNQAQPVRDQQIAGMLARQLAGDERDPEEKLRLVYLAACQSATRSAADAFRGLAPKLVVAGVPAVLAMQDKVPIVTAQAFAATFYAQLLLHGQVDLAANQARSAILTADLPGAAIPVLFMRLRGGQLFLPATPDEQPQGDARPQIETRSFEPETLLVPAGPFLMGSQAGPDIPTAEVDQHVVDLPAFRIGRFPVTNGQYERFLRDNKHHDIPKDAGWFNRRPPVGREDHPVTGVSWADAVAYCRWLSQETGRHYRLPSEAEWEKAGGDAGTRRQGDAGTGRYPWGEEWVEGVCNVGGEGTTAVDAHPDGSSGYGVEDLLGNVQEWTRSLWGAGTQAPDFGYPYDPGDGREVEAIDDLPTLGRIVHRGGSYRSRAKQVSITRRGHADPASAIAWRGFRVAMKIG